MGLFAVSYDLIANKDYARIQDEIERLGGVRVQLSYYLLNLTNEDPVGVKNHLARFVDSDDRLMVVKFTGRPAFTKALTGTNNWIDRNCP